MTTDESGRKSRPSPLRHHVHFAVERVAPAVAEFGRITVEEQVAVFAQGAAGVRDAHAVLPAVFPLLRYGRDGRDELPAACGRVNGAFGRGVELGARAVAGEEPVQLRPASAGVPGVSVDLGDFDGGAKVYAEAPAGGAGVEEEVRLRVVVGRRKRAVRKRAQVRAVGVR